MAHSTRARITQVDDVWRLVQVSYDYSLKEEIKRVPGTMWRPEVRGWYVPEWSWSEVEDLLDIYNLLGPSGDRGASPRSSGRPSLSDALAEVYAAVPGQLRKPLSRAVVQVLHPDHGGTDELAREAIEAMRRAS